MVDEVSLCQCVAVLKRPHCTWNGTYDKVDMCLCYMDGVCAGGQQHVV